MVLHGHTKIELHNVKTDEDTVIEKDNIVTGVWESIWNAYRKTGFSNIGFRPSVPYNAFSTTYYGGILCYEDEIEEDTSNFFGMVGNTPVAYANQSTHSTKNMKRGNPNVNTTQNLSNGFQFVWDWTTEQGNGTISSVCLTTNQAGAYECGDTFARLTGIAYGSYVTNATNNCPPGLINQVLAMATRLDEDGYIWSVLPINSTTVRLYKINTCLTKATVNKMLCTPNTPSQIPYETFDVTLSANSIQYVSATAVKCQFFDCGEFFYGFANAGNSSGNATVYWSKIYKSDLRVEEGSFVLTECYLHAIANNRTTVTGTSDVCASFYSEYMEGYLFVWNYSSKGVYKINPETGEVISLINTGAISTGYADGNTAFSTTTSTNYKPQCKYYLKKFGSKIYNGAMYFDPISEKVSKMASAIYLDGGYWHHPIQLFDSPLYISFTGQSGGSYAWYGRGAVFLLCPAYLATINNLEEPVVKTADMTMKITYTITME